MKHASVFLTFLIAFATYAATPPAPPSNPISPLLPPQPQTTITNTALVYTNVAVKTATIAFDSVTIYGGTNALKGATVISWTPSPSVDVTGSKLYYGPTTLAETNVFAVKQSVSTVLFYNVLNTNYVYWMYVTVTNASGLESEPSNSILVPGK